MDHLFALFGKLCDSRMHSPPLLDQLAEFRFGEFLVHDVGGLEDNPAESDSEDEWNYIKGDQAKQETLPSQPEAVEESDQEDTMSQLNPDAAEFVPVSPTRSIPSPACRALINDEVIAQSPKRPVAVDINVPNENDFNSEVKSRPSEVDPYSNGHNGDAEDIKDVPVESLLNGKSLDEIPEFQPASTPIKVPPTNQEEFHFGPNAAPFTPKLLDQSEVLSTKANYGDDTEQLLNDSEITINKENLDPMSMSFYAEKGESNPFDEDLNKVHDLPDNLDEFLGKEEGKGLDDTISDLPEHEPLGDHLDNDEQAAIQTTDLDKLSQEDEKELASPLDPDDDTDDVIQIHSSKSPELFKGVVDEKPADEFNIESLPELEPVTNDSNILPESEAPAEEQFVNGLSPTESPAIPQESELEISSPVHSDFVPQQINDLEQTSTALQEVSDSLEPNSFQMEQESKSSVQTFDELAESCPLPGNQMASNLVDLGLAEAEVIHQAVSENQACDFRSKEERPLFGGFEEVKSPISDLNQPSDTFETEFNPKSESEHLDLEAHELQTTAVIETHSPIDLQEQKHEEEITSSVKDDISSPIEQMSPVKSPEHQIEDDFTQEQVTQNGAAPQDFEICIKTENVKPEFPEQTIITPSEDSKGLDEVPSAPLVEEVPKVEEPSKQEEPKPEAPKAVPDVVQDTKGVAKKDIRKSADLAAVKKSTSKTTPSKTPTASKTGLAAKTTPRPSPAASKPTAASKLTPKTGAPKTSATTKPTLAAAKPSPKPKTAAPAPKPTERKLLTNGEAKPSARTTLTKKPSTEVTATKTISRPATAAGKPNTTLPRTTAPRPATAPRTTAPKTTSATAPKPTTTTTAPKPRVQLSTRTVTKTTSSTTAAPKTNGTAARAPTTQPKPATAPAKPRTITRVPPTKPISKNPDVEKQNKESANKLTASRTTTVTKTSSVTATGRISSTTVKKTESKPATTRSIASKTTNTTTKSAVSKKANEPKPITKPKTTKVEKPKENGIAPTNITEEITTVNNIVNETETFLKDNSPLDNKLITEPAVINTLIDVNPAD